MIHGEKIKEYLMKTNTTVENVCALTDIPMQSLLNSILYDDDLKDEYLLKLSYLTNIPAVNFYYNLPLNKMSLRHRMQVEFNIRENESLLLEELNSSFKKNKKN